MKHLSILLLVFSISLIIFNCGGKTEEEAEKVTPIAVKTAEIISQDINGVLGFFGNIEGELRVP